MDLDVVPFEPRFTADAAALLAGCHAPAAGAVDPVDFAAPGVARRLVTEWQGTGPAVAALDGGTLVGFMAARTPAAPGGQTAGIRMQQHAAAPHATRLIYRRLYAALSGRLTALGAFEHALAVCAAHRSVVTGFVELGFGIDQIKGIRALVEPAGAARDASDGPDVPHPPNASDTPNASDAPNIMDAPNTPNTPDAVLREARADDIPALLRLTLELQRFHTGPPMHRPALLDLPAIKAGFEAALADERRLLYVAEDHGRLIGLMTADPDRHRLRTATIGIAVVTAAVRSRGVGGALLSGVLDWAGRHGFTACAAGWTSANPVSDAFWRGHGFVPVQYRLTRLIDSRVAWADARLGYEDFFPGL